MEPFINTLIQAKYNRLNEWRKRYSRREYPVKLGLNLLYEGLTIKKDWTDIKKSFDSENQGMFTSFDDADTYLYSRRRNIQVNEILPIVENQFKKIEKLPYLDFSSFRNRCYSAQKSQSNPEIIEEIEFTYFFHTSAYELIYRWSALGLIGYNQNQAFENISNTVFEDIDFNSLELLVQAFGKVSSMYYKPLPNY